jgi:hypothetical protein
MRIRRKRALKSTNETNSHNDVTDITSTYYIRKRTNISRVVDRIGKRSIRAEFEKHGRYKLGVNQLIDTYTSSSSSSRSCGPQRFPNPLDAIANKNNSSDLTASAEAETRGRIIKLRACGAAIPKCILVADRLQTKYGPDVVSYGFVDATTVLAVDEVEDLESFDLHEEDRRIPSICIQMIIS